MEYVHYALPLGNKLHYFAFANPEIGAQLPLSVLSYFFRMLWPSIETEMNHLVLTCNAIIIARRANNKQV